MEKSNLPKLLSQLTQSYHGDLYEYFKITYITQAEDPEFFQHLISWNTIKGEIRDSKAALPIISLRCVGLPKDLAENAVANLLLLSPRELLKAYLFNKELTMKGYNLRGWSALLRNGIQMYLRYREDNHGWWVSTVLQHRKSMKALYAVSHTSPTEYAQKILFDNDPPVKSIFYKIKQLKTMTAQEAAGTILQYHIPFQIAFGALQQKKSYYIENPELILALINSMSGQQLLANTKMLMGLGISKSPVIMSEYSAAVERTKKDKKTSTYKASKAIEILSEDASIPSNIKAKLESVQNEKIAQKSIEGDWLILADASGSMQQAIKYAVEITSYLTATIKGNVHLIFFNTNPRYFNMTGKTLNQIQQETRNVMANGSTSCGCGIEYIRQKGIVVDGIVLVSDGGENHSPYFAWQYAEYARKIGSNPTVYFYHVDGDPDRVSGTLKRDEIDYTYIDTNKVDYYSLPNVIAQMKTNKYDLYEEIMNTPLLTFSDVFTVNK